MGKLNIKPLEKWSYDNDHESKGPNAQLHPMFEGWQPTQASIKHLFYTKQINTFQQMKYSISFVSFFFKKQHIVKFKTQWNSAFIEHCERNAEWENKI
jgi:hypothetical protein